MGLVISPFQGLRGFRLSDTQGFTSVLIDSALSGQTTFQNKKERGDYIKQNSGKIINLLKADKQLNGFQKKTQKTPKNEIKKAIILMREYYESRK